MDRETIIRKLEKMKEVLDEVKGEGPFLGEDERYIGYETSVIDWDERTLRFGGLHYVDNGEKIPGWYVFKC